MRLLKLERQEETDNYIFVGVVRKGWFGHSRRTVVWHKTKGFNRVVAETGDKSLWVIDEAIMEAFIESNESIRFFNN